MGITSKKHYTSYNAFWFSGLTLVVLIFNIATLQGQEIESDILQKKWKAFWIHVPGEPEHEYGVYKFRKEIKLQEKPASFIVHVSADNRYKLYVNGQLVSHGPARSEIFHYNFETVDLAPYLLSGKNVIAATVWNFGKHRPEAQVSYRTAFILQGNSAAEDVINSDRSWLCIRDESYEPLIPELIYTYYVSGPGEKIDFNKSVGNWTSASYDDTHWKRANEIFNGLPKGVFEWTSGWMLVPRPIPQMHLTPQRLGTTRSATGMTVPKSFPSVKTAFTIPANKKITMLLDQQFLTNAYPVLLFSKGKGASISLRYAEALYVVENTNDWKAQKQKGNRNEIKNKRFVGVKDQLISNGKDDQSFTTLAWRTYRYVEIEIETQNEALTIDDFYGISTGYPFQWTSHFATKNPEINNILQVGLRTAALCAVETYMDCPYYEQLQYIGDTRIQALVTLFNTKDDKLVRNAINQLDQSRMAEGITLSRYPSANAQQIPTFSLFWIGMLHDYWMYRNDPDFVAQKLTGVRQILDFFKRYQQSDGSLKNAPYWVFTDWASTAGWNKGVPPIGKDGNSAALDLQLCWAYEVAAEMEEAMGMKEYAARYREAASTLATTIKAKYWSSSKQLFADTPEQNYFSQHTNTLAVLAGIVSGEPAMLLMEKILSDTSVTQATIYFKYYVHQAAAKTGLGDRYLDMLGDWHVQLASGLTTWAEISDVNNSRSDCHAWGASPNIELFRIILGINSGAPGFRKIMIEPRLGNLQQANGKIPHPEGEVIVNYYQVKKKWKADLSIPKNTTGTFKWKGKIFPLAGGHTTLDL